MSPAPPHHDAPSSPAIRDMGPPPVETALSHYVNSPVISTPSSRATIRGVGNRCAEVLTETAMPRAPRAGLNQRWTPKSWRSMPRPLQPGRSCIFAMNRNPIYQPCYHLVAGRGNAKRRAAQEYPADDSLRGKEQGTRRMMQGAAGIHRSILGSALRSHNPERG